MESPETPQPLMPRISMIWYFVVATLIAILAMIIMRAESRQPLAVAIVFTGMLLLFFLLIGGGAFLIAFAVGATEKMIAPKQTTPESPFIDGRLPPQIIPPKPMELE